MGRAERGPSRARELSNPGAPAPVVSAPCLVFLKSHVIDHVRPALQGPPLPFGVRGPSHWASCLSLRLLLRPVPAARCGRSWLFSVPALCQLRPPRGGRPDARLPGKRGASRQPPPWLASSPTATCGLRPLLPRPVCVGCSSLTAARLVPCPPPFAPASPRWAPALTAPPLSGPRRLPGSRTAPSSGVSGRDVCPASCPRRAVSFRLCLLSHPPCPEGTRVTVSHSGTTAGPSAPV